ncbi:BREX-2 system adenine-specific DNA-methyltransferase PglX [Actinomadura sp. GTD37]|uniref:BREX-2 system adenine-specific DNA-methyltransferase PglX n=1 Tax=Actinomadura sp. GTD37 TaxID=1778030 RepID=UPI0035BF9E3F
MIDRSALLTDLKLQVKALEPELRERASNDQDIHARLNSEWLEAREAGRIAATYEMWLEDRVTQAAVAWVLGTAFLRFCEDNVLIELPFLAGPGERLDLAQGRQERYVQQHPRATDRDWILAGFAELSKSPVAARLFDQAHNPMWQIEISNDAVRALLAFWRGRGKDGAVVHDFTDPGWDTRFFGDLYQDLSEYAKKTYALLQTPEFVEEFILDYTLEPAIREFGLQGLRLLDPVCGSGQFVLGAFHRVFAHWTQSEPAADRLDLVRRSLGSVHGADKNPAAVTITCFRLLIEAMRAAGIRRLREVPSLPMSVQTADALLEGRGAPAPTPNPHLWEELDSPPPLEDDLLGAGSYHVVVGNPPYITPKDRAEAENYRNAYPASTGAFALPVPFTQRFFQLAQRGAPNGSRAGYVGILTANSFTKREFGRKLIEEYLAKVELTHVVDTSGVYIPGHGTPTILLVGRRRVPDPAVPVLAVLGVRGEPFPPEEPGHGLAWQSVLRRFAGYTDPDEWTEVVQLDRSVLQRFPWNLGGGTARDLLALMDGDRRLGKRVVRIGYVASTGADDLFTAPAASWRRAKTETAPLVDVITGSEVRDWTVLPERQAFFPLAPRGSPHRWVPISDHPAHLRRLWPYRTLLQSRRSFGGGTYAEAGRAWHEWHQVTLKEGEHPWSIVFPWVATYPSFAVLEDTTTAVPLNSAPVIKLPLSASEQDVVQLTAVLNSSVVAFWLKHNSHSKGRPGGGRTGGGEAWEIFYEFVAHRLGELPLPPERPWGSRWSVHAESLHALANEVELSLPAKAVHGETALARALRAAHDRWTRARRKMIALQEELDWEIYERYGIVPEPLPPLPPEELPEIGVGERAFEIVLARRMEEGRVNTDWFVRHNAPPVTEPPANWPSAYRERVRQRIELIQKVPYLSALEQPEFKRRWVIRDWEAMERSALRDWLLDRLEDPELWYEEREGARWPATKTADELIERVAAFADVSEALALYMPGSELSTVVEELLRGHQVPYLPVLYLRERSLQKYERWKETWALQRCQDAQGTDEEIPPPPKYTSADFLRQTYWSQRGRSNVPNERFISYPGTGRFGWAGWDHRERALILVGLIEEGYDAVPLLAGLLDLLPWVEQWHAEADSSYGGSPAEMIESYIEEVMAVRGLTREGVLGWRPPPPKRGRPRKSR